jgi:hypothetical protein
MRRGRYLRYAVAGALAAGLLGGAATASPGGSTSQQQTCPILGMDPDSVTLAGPPVLWPANHRLVAYTLTASETPQEASDGLPHGITISYTVTVLDDGSASGPANDPDAQPPTGTATGDFSVPIDFQLRAERAGDGSGRTYQVDWAATFDGGPHMCSSTDPGQRPFFVTVPHDQSS